MLPEEWESLPWWQQRMYLEGMEHELSHDSEDEIVDSPGSTLDPFDNAALQGAGLTVIQGGGV